MSAEGRHDGIDDESSPPRSAVPSRTNRLGSLPLLAALVCAGLLPFLLSGLYLVAGFVILAVAATAIIAWSWRADPKASVASKASDAPTDIPGTRSPESASIFCIETAIERCGGEEECLVQLVEVSRTEFPKLLAAARAACDDNNAESLQRTAHTLKGSALIFAAEPARKACEHVEMLARQRRHHGADMDAAMEQMTLRIGELLAALEAHATHAVRADSPP